MHPNDALGHQEGLHCIYNHHEQASAMGAEAYARIHNRIAASVSPPVLGEPMPLPAW